MSSYETTKKWREKNPEKLWAHRAVFSYLRSGKLKKKPCKICGDLKVEAHHTDYSKVLQVIWLCRRHHIEADKALRIKAIV